MKLVERAIKQRWPFSDEYKAHVVTEMLRIIASPTAKERTKISAAAVLARFESQNQADEHKQADITRAEMAGIAEQLGLVAGAETIQPEQPGSDPPTIADAAKRAGIGCGEEAGEAERSGQDNHPGSQGPAAT